MSAIDQIRAGILAEVAQHERALQYLAVELLLLDRVEAAMRREQPTRRDLRSEVLNQLSAAPTTVQAIQRAIGGRRRDIETVLSRLGMDARWTEAGWVRVETEMKEAAE